MRADRARRLGRRQVLPARRWTDAQILEEHAFVAELAAREIPVVAPLPLRRHEHAGVRSRLPLRRLSECGGRAPELEDRGDAGMDGPLHRAHPRDRRGCAFRQRPALDIASFRRGAARLAAGPRLHPGRHRRRVAKHRRAGAGGRAALLRARRRRCATLRLHGDCHAGNVLWTDAGPHFVDFDDARMGPAIQDLWMLLSGDRGDMARQLRAIAQRLRGLSRIRRPRAASGRGVAHAAAHSLLGVAGAALGRPRVSRGFPVVQHPALLAGPDPRIARAGRADGRAGVAFCRAECSGLPGLGSRRGRRRRDAGCGRCAPRDRDRG